jgi:hypothetical protein
MIMNRFVLLMLGLLFLIGSAAAYQVTISAPESVSVGKPLLVTGTTTYGIGTAINVILYHQVTTNTEVQRKTGYVLTDGTFRVVFDTTGLKKGTYKVEVTLEAQGDSITTRLVQLIDRSDEIVLSSPQEQQFTGTLTVAGLAQGNQNSGIQVEVTDPAGDRILGPQYIGTTSRGYFSVQVPIGKTGVYDVSFTDSKGFIGTKTVSVIGSVPAPTATVTATVTTPAELLSAHTKSSRDAPAYFEVKAGSYRMNVYTSSDIDWMMEYIDDRGVLHTVLSRTDLNPEEINVQGRGKTIYFKVYPLKYSDSGVVFLYADNAQSVKVSPTVPSVFGTSPTPIETQKSPASPALGIAAVGLAMVLIGGQRKNHF